MTPINSLYCSIPSGTSTSANIEPMSTSVKDMVWPFLRHAVDKSNGLFYSARQVVNGIQQFTLFNHTSHQIHVIVHASDNVQDRLHADTMRQGLFAAMRQSLRENEGRDQHDMVLGAHTDGITWSLYTLESYQGFTHEGEEVIWSQVHNCPLFDGIHQVSCFLNVPLLF